MYIGGEIYTFHTDTDKIFVESTFYIFELVEGFDDNDYETYSAAVGKLKCKAFIFFWTIRMMLKNKKQEISRMMTLQQKQTIWF